MNKRIQPKDKEILSIISELSKAVRCCRQDEVFCEDVTFTQFVILDEVAGNETLDMARLHEILSVDKSTTTRLIAPLIRRNLVVREKAGHDSRAATLRLTREGKEVHEKVWQCLISFIRSIQDEIPKNKRKSALEGIRMFLGALRNASALRCTEDARPGACRCSNIM